MIKNSTKKAILLNFLFLVVINISCGNDDEDPILDISKYKALSISVEDIDNNGNASDVSISFTPAAANDEITEYRLVYAKVSSNTEVTATLLKSLDQPSYSKVTTDIQPLDNNFGITLNKDQLSLDGENILENEDYKIYILSIGTFNNDQVLMLSDASESFKITDTSVLDINLYTAQITSASDADNNGNASDIQVVFDGGSASSMIEEYRLIVAKSSVISQIDLEAAKALTSASYTSITNDKSNYEISLPETQLDFEGASIVTDINYQAMVLTIGTFKEESVYALSNASLEFELIQNIETTTLTAAFEGNGALTIDADGNIYVSEYGVAQANDQGSGNSAFKITPSGDITEFVSDLSGPVGNAIDAEGNYYVNNGNNNVSGDFLKIAPNGTQTVIATLDGFPSDILVGTDGNFYMANWTQPVVHKVTPDGTVTEFASDSRLQGGVGIVYDDNGNILVGNFSTGEILSIDQSGNISSIATIPTVVANFVIGYITFFEEHIYATGYGSNKIYKVSLDGNVNEFAGTGSRTSVDGELANATFITPNGITVDKNRRLLYISQNGNGSDAALRVIPLE